MNVYDGRPAVKTGRLEREIRTYDLLDKLGISYQRTDHEPADHMEACYRIDSVLNVEICKNLFLCNRQKSVQDKGTFRTDPFLQTFLCGA